MTFVNTLNCPSCDGELTYLESYMGRLGGRDFFKCKFCGMPFSKVPEGDNEEISKDEENG